MAISKFVKKALRKSLLPFTVTAAILLSYPFVKNYIENPDNYYASWVDYHLAQGFNTSANTDIENFKFVVYGDTRDNPTAHYKIARLIKKQEPDFIIHTGDLVKNGRHRIYWDEFFSAANHLKNIPIFPCLGNHEKNSRLYYQIFSLPGNEQFYSFNYGKCHFSFLDSNTLSRKQLRWLSEDLKNSHERKKFLIFHHPFYKMKKVSSKVKKELEQIINELKISVVFNGHAHNYQRNEDSGTTYIITGGGGAPLSYSGDSKIKFIKNHFVALDIFGNKIHGKAISIDNKVLDEFFIE